MRRIGGEAPLDPATRVGGDATSFVEKLYGARGQPHLDLLLRELIGHRVIMPVRLHVVVDVGLGLFPLPSW